LAALIADNQANVRERHDADAAEGPAEEVLVRAAAGVHTSIVEADTLGLLERAVEELGPSGGGLRRVVVRQGGALVTDNTRHLFALMFAARFPFGSGDPDAKRTVAVSRAECIKHLLKLSTREGQPPGSTDTATARGDWRGASLGSPRQGGMGQGVRV